MLAYRRTVGWCGSFNRIPNLSEGQYVGDVAPSGQQHHDPIDAHRDSRRRWHALRQGLQEVLVQRIGRLTRPLAGAVISGSGPAALAAIDLVGNDAAMDPAAAGCSKAEQTIPVSLGHPTLRIRSLVVEPLGPGGEDIR